MMKIYKLFLLAIFLLPIEIVSARDSKFTRKGSGPLLWNVYEYCYLGNKPMPENVWKANVDWVAANFLEYGFNIVATDGWNYNATTIDSNGYLSKYDDSWVGDLKTWGDYIKAKGMEFGFYYNPLSVPTPAYNKDIKIIGTTVPVRNIVHKFTSGDDFQWIDTNKPGAEQWVKGCIRTMIKQGITYLKVDFLWAYEDLMGSECYARGLQWMAEEAGDELFLSLSMPLCHNNGRNEVKYGDMIRTGSDTNEGGWYFVSEKERGTVHAYGPVNNKYQCVFDGLIGYSHITGKGQLIPDGDFVRLNTMGSDSEKQSWISLLVISGSAVGIADQHNTIGNNAKFYQNRELMELNKLGFVGKPITDDISNYKNSSRWIGQLPDGDWVVGLFNREQTSIKYEIDFKKELAIESGSVTNVRDLWLHQDLGQMTGKYSVDLPPRSCKILRIKSNSTIYKAAIATLTNGAFINSAK